MIVVTSGKRYLDIDAYACIVAYAELLQLLEQDVRAVSTAILNESITPRLRALPAHLADEYRPSERDTFVAMDVSDPSNFDSIVSVTRISEIFDHHPGFEQYWNDRLGNLCHIEPIGAAATLVFEQWENTRKLKEMSATSALLLAAAILDNTLNFNASITRQRDRTAYKFLCEHAGLSDQWAAEYFSDCQKAIASDLVRALKNDTKLIKFNGLPYELCVGQLVVWDAGLLITNKLTLIAKQMSAIYPKWFVNIVSISDGHSYFLSEDHAVKKWLQNLLGITYEGQTAKSNRLWLRKEIIKADVDLYAAEQTDIASLSQIHKELSTVREGLGNA